MLKTIMVHLDVCENTRARLQLAATLAKRHGARLIGAFCQRSDADQVGVVFTWPSAEYAQAATEAREMFRELAVDTPAADWLDINRGSDEEILKGIVSAARYCDLFVAGRSRMEDLGCVAKDLPEVAAARSGRPVLLVPHQGEWALIGMRPLLVWDASAESARAIKDALPLIQPNAEVTVLSLGLPEADQAAGDIIGFLASHGVHARAENFTSVEEGSWELILGRIDSLGSDLLVIGAHEQPGFPFVRRDVVREESPIPVLLAS